MCLIGLAVAPPGPWLLVVAANRDEFHDRASEPAGYWDGKPEGLLAGRDLQGGGTWLGLRRAAGGSRLRIGALTNLRPGLMPKPELPQASSAGVPPSRGHLVTAFLRADCSPEQYLLHLQPPGAAYAGFNLLAIELGLMPPGADSTAHAGEASPGPSVGKVAAWYLNNLPGQRPLEIPAGVHALSNATLDVPWPKTQRLQRAMHEQLACLPAGGHSAGGTTGAGDAARLGSALLDALADRTTAAPEELPNTGLEPERERLLSAPFIVDPHYGTRCSTVIVVARSGAVFFAERRFGPGGRLLGTTTEGFELTAASAIG